MLIGRQSTVDCPPEMAGLDLAIFRLWMESVIIVTFPRSLKQLFL